MTIATISDTDILRLVFWINHCFWNFLQNAPKALESTMESDKNWKVEETQKKGCKGERRKEERKRGRKGDPKGVNHPVQSTSVPSEFRAALYSLNLLDVGIVKVQQKYIFDARVTLILFNSHKENLKSCLSIGMFWSRILFHPYLTFVLHSRPSGQ